MSVRQTDAEQKRLGILVDDELDAIYGSGAKNPNIEAKISFTTKNVIKQNISQITSRVRQLFRITGL